MLERTSHEEACFATFTYDDEHYPADGCVSVREVQLFLERLRDRIHPATVRYYFVGEYGSRTFRAHYHAALYGVSDAELIHSAWQRGFTFVGDLTFQSAAYIAGYLVKGMTKKGDDRLDGRTPEFARMSLRPGLGALAISRGAYQQTKDGVVRFVLRSGDVPEAFRVEGRSWPLGRYLRRVYRKSLGLDGREPEVKNAERQLKELELRRGRWDQRVAEIEGERVQSGRAADARESITRSKRRL